MPARAPRPATESAFWLAAGAILVHEHEHPPGAVRLGHPPSRGGHYACCMSVRVRMAPSPTGFLHIGGVRTFLFNWLFARGRGGECLLRIENTDISREVADATEQIQHSLRWLGIDWDGGRLPTSSTRWSAAVRWRRAWWRRARLRGTRRDRFRVRGCRRGRDRLGRRRPRRIEFPNDQLEDLVIIRSDGRATYKLREPGRGHGRRDHACDPRLRSRLEHAQATRDPGGARHEPPVYAHVPDVLGSDGKKLSKRHGATAVDDFRLAGYLPEALMNFIALLGWAPTARDHDHEPGRARRALHSRSRRLEPGDLRLREARLDERRLPPRAATGRVRRAADRLPSRAGRRVVRGAGPRCRAARPGEDRAARTVPEFAGFLFERRNGYAHAELDPEVLAAAADALAELEPFTAGGDRGGVAGACRPPGPEAPAGVPGRSGSPSRARRSHRGCSRASSCSGARRPSRGSEAPTRQRPRPRQRIQGTLELPPGAPLEAGCRPWNVDVQLERLLACFSHFKVRTVRRGPWLRTVGQVTGGDEREPDRPHRPEHEDGARRERDDPGDGECSGDRGREGKPILGSVAAGR